MTKYLVDVYVPAIDTHYDVWLPAGKTIIEVTQLLKTMIPSLSEDSYRGSEETLLIDALSGNYLNPQGTIYDVGIRNASKLILI